MARRLRSMAARVDTGFRYANAARVAAMEARTPPPQPSSRLVYEARLARERLYAGQTAPAIRTFEGVLREAEDRKLLSPRNRVVIHDLLATAYFRLGQERNCLSGVGTPACLVPTPPDGIHRDPSGDRSAAVEFRKVLEAEPDNLGARWLLNLSAMMSGAYPGSVPPRWRIPQAAFASEYPLPRFPDAAPATGLDVLGHAGGVVLDDLDGDGDLDVMVSSWLLGDPLRFFRNEGDGTFRERTSEAGLTGLTGGLNLVQADYDNDGDLDVLVLRGGWLSEGEPNSLLRNEGNGRFSDVTAEAGLLQPIYPTQTAAWADFDGDGWVDLFVGNESSPGRIRPAQLFHNERDGTFADVAAQDGAAVTGLIKGVVWGDYDDDDRPDLYISRRGQPNLLLHNEGPGPGGRWSFREVGKEAGVGDPIDSFTTWFWDYDNDGRLDLFVSGYRSHYGDVAAEYLGLPHRSEFPRLYRNEGDGSFLDVTAQAQLNRILFTMGGNFGDLDGDGWLDFYVGTGDMDFQALMPNRMFRNDEGRRFQEVTSAGGFGHVQKGHGVAFGDVDGDGDQDVYAVMGGALEGDLARNVLFRNPGAGHAWITLRLEGTRSNRAAIGARVRVSVETPGAAREVYRTVGSGGSFGAGSLELNIGLGAACAIRAVEIRWPVPGETSRFRGLSPNRVYRLREGDDTAHPSGPGGAAPPDC
ncbi:MAG: CRTAC1 family protein [Gemmatimonadota bacterium]